MLGATFVHLIIFDGFDIVMH